MRTEQKAASSWVCAVLSRRCITAYKEVHNTAEILCTLKIKKPKLYLLTIRKGEGEAQEVAEKAIRKDILNGNIYIKFKTYKTVLHIILENIANG